MTPADTPLNPAAQSQLRSIIERIERLEVEKAEIADHIKEVFAEARGNGFDAKILRKVIRLRKMDAAKRAEEEAITDLYLSALGELPLFAGRGESAAPSAITRVSLTLADGTVVGGTLAEVKAAAEEVQRERATDDGLYAQAVALVRDSGKPSTSFIQRRLQLGYNRAAGLIRRMEREGVIGPANHAGKRELLIEGANG